MIIIANIHLSVRFWRLSRAQKSEARATLKEFTYFWSHRRNQFSSSMLTWSAALNSDACGTGGTGGQKDWLIVDLNFGLGAKITEIRINANHVDLTPGTSRTHRLLFGNYGDADAYGDENFTFDVILNDVLPVNIPFPVSSPSNNEENTILAIELEDPVAGRDMEIRELSLTIEYASWNDLLGVTP